MRSGPRQLATGVVTAVLLGLLLTPGGSRAAVPSPTASTAVVTIKVGGDRDTSTTIGPLAGITYGFFRTQPTHWNDNDGDTTDTPEWTCVSDADGDCSVAVPIGAGGITAGTRLWAAVTDSTADWFANPLWQTGPLSPSTAHPLVSLRHVFQTPALYGNRTYRSGADWITDPGLQTSPASSTEDYARRTASGGVWPLSRVDPALPDQCGLKVALVVDLSSSVDGHIADVRTALDTYVDALRGTPSTAALYTFGTGSPALGFEPNSSPMSVATTADAAKFKALYAGWHNNFATNYTNWDAGIDAVAQDNAALPAADRFDLAVVITDGNPTVYGPLTSNGQVDTRTSGYTRFWEIGTAVASANLLKSQGTRVVAVGVGSGATGDAKYNLRAISGRDAYDGTNILDADYLQASSYDAVGDALHDLVLSSCAPSISVIKRIVPPGGGIADSYIPTEPWTFAATTASPGASVDSTSPAQTAPGSGGVSFNVTVPATGTSDFTVAETQQAGYSTYPVDRDGTGSGTQNASCVDKQNGTDQPVTVTNVGTDGFTVPVGIKGVISCVVYNQAPTPPPPIRPAQLTVEKRWQVVTDVPGGTHTDTYPQGEQPAGLESTLSLTGPEAAAASEQPWGVERGGYAEGDRVTVAEHVDLGLPGCTLTSASLNAYDGTGPTGPTTDLGVSSPSGDVTLAAGGNHWIVTNQVHCVSHLILTKRVVGGSAPPSAWTLHADGPTGALTGPSGSTGVSAEVTPELTYQLAESHGDDPALLEYVQDDERSRPLQNPLSTGSMACNVAGAAGDATGAEGGVVVPLGQDMVCTATNRTAQISVVKDVVGGGATPAEWTFHLTPVDPAVDGLRSHTLAGAAAPGSTTTLRPGQSYRLEETGDVDGYQLRGLSCATVEPTARGILLTVTAGANITCTATNSYSTWTSSKTSDPVSGSTVAPGSVITYTVHADHLAGHATEDVRIVDDLTHVLDHATLIEGSIDASTGHAHLDGHRLVWTIPSLTGHQRLVYRVRVAADAAGVTLHNVLTRHTTTEPGDPGDPAAVCEASRCPHDAADEETDHPVSAATPTLPDTGGPPLWPLPAGAGLVVAGAALLGLRIGRGRA
jgi:hypothetical protein